MMRRRMTLTLMMMAGLKPQGHLLYPRLSGMADLSQTYKLWEAERKHFDENGFLVIKELIDCSTLYSCKQRFSQICNRVVDKGCIQIVKEPALIPTGAKGEGLVNKAQYVHFDSVFSLYTENPRLLDVLSQLIGDDVYVMHSMLINKPPGSTHHLPHQDLYYFPFRPAKWMVAAWTAIDHVNVDNGCLYVIPGSHRDNKLYEHGATPGSNHLYHSILNEVVVAPQQKRVYLEMSPGDTVLFHPLLVHGSGPNVSKRYRKAMTAHYRNSRCWTADVNRDLAEECVRSMRRGHDITYTELWLEKQKHVKGVHSKV